MIEKRQRKAKSLSVQQYTEDTKRAKKIGRRPSGIFLTMTPLGISSTVSLCCTGAAAAATTEAAPAAAPLAPRGGRASSLGAEGAILAADA